MCSIRFVLNCLMTTFRKGISSFLCSSHIVSDRDHNSIKQWLFLSHIMLFSAKLILLAVWVSHVNVSF